ncbi:MAG: hypothetical protein ACP5G7_12095 [Anaerolineae bacterium]
MMNKRVGLRWAISAALVVLGFVVIGTAEATFWGRLGMGLGVVALAALNAWLARER